MWYTILTVLGVILALGCVYHRYHQRIDRRLNVLADEVTEQINTELAHVLALCASNQLELASGKRHRITSLNGAPMYVTRRSQIRAMHLWRYENDASPWVAKRPIAPDDYLDKPELILAIDLRNVVDGVTVGITIDPFKAQLLRTQSKEYVRRCLQEYVVRLITHITIHAPYSTEKRELIDAAFYSLSRNLLNRYAVVSKKAFLDAYGDGLMIIEFTDVFQ